MEKFKTSDYVNIADSELRWVFIDLPGKDDLNGKPRFVASLYVKTEKAQPLIDAIDAFWEENKPKGGKCKSKGYRIEVEGDEGAEKPTGYVSFNFWTGTTFKDGNTRTIDIYNAKGNKISLGGKKIGNGSFGAVSGTMAIYDSGVAARGVTLYLNALQIFKFEEFVTDAGFDSQEGGFEGVESEFEGTTTDEEAKPRL